MKKRSATRSFARRPRGKCCVCGKRTSRKAWNDLLQEERDDDYECSDCSGPSYDDLVRQGDIPDEDGIWHFPESDLY